MPSFLQALDAEIAELERELERHPVYVKLREAKRLRAVYSQPSGEGRSSIAAKPSSARVFMSGSSAEILDALRSYLRGRTTPTPTRHLMDELAMRKIAVGGTVPQNVVSSLLSKSSDFISHGRSGWTLVEEKADDAGLNEAASPASDQPQSTPVESGEEAHNEKIRDIFG